MRNFLYDRGIYKSHSFEPIVISVGNLSVGGTGKSPMVEWLVGYLKANFHPSVLSRGYGRRSRGFRLLTEQDDAQQVGDEPLQIFQRFGAEVPVAVAENRALGIVELMLQKPETNLIILDDAYQHRSVRPDIQILLTDYWRLFTRDTLLPAGNLREPKKGAQRADMVVVTKCSMDISKANMHDITAEIRRTAGKDLPVYFAGLSYDELQPFDLKKGYTHPPFSRVIAVSGLANSKAFHEYLSSKFDLVQILDFPDHYRYQIKDFQYLSKLSKSLNAAIVCTSKDAVKWQSKEFFKLAKELPAYVLPVRHQFIGVDFGQEIDKLLMSLR